MLPGDFISMKLTGNISTSIAALSEGVFWDFQKNELSEEVFSWFDLSRSLIPKVNDVFSEHGRVTGAVAAALSLRPGIPVTYKAGDQPNNALSLNVMEPGEVAATAGTSGVIYGISDQLTYDNESRVNSFAHVNYTKERKRLGVLLCINGTGILNRWVKNISGDELDYEAMNKLAGNVPPGSDGLMVFPFGNGAERMLNNRTVHAHIHNIDLNKHGSAHLYRAAQEGIVYAFRYGLDIMRENGMSPRIIRAGRTNMFLSELFTKSFASTLNVPVEMYETNGSVGAAIGAGIGANIYSGSKEAFRHIKPVGFVEPEDHNLYDEHYQHWVEQLNRQLN